MGILIIKGSINKLEDLNIASVHRIKAVFVREGGNDFADYSSVDRNF